jgi:hypothetical protein
VQPAAAPAGRSRASAHIGESPQQRPLASFVMRVMAGGDVERDGVMRACFQLVFSLDYYYF